MDIKDLSEKLASALNDLEARGVEFNAAKVNLGAATDSYERAISTANAAKDELNKVLAEAIPPVDVRARKIQLQ